MYVSNAEYIKSKRYECGKLVGKYLIKRGFPLLSQRKKVMIFSKTRKLQEAINTMPFYLRILVKVGVING